MNNSVDSQSPKPIRQRFFSGIVWTFVQSVGVKGFTFVVGIVLARLLSPDDFGLFGVLAVFFTVSQVFIESGFGQALVQKPDCSEVDYSTAFFFNVLISLVIYAGLFAFAPLIAGYFHKTQLVSVIRVASLNFVIGSINVVQRAKLTKALNFRPLTIINLLGTVLGGVVAIILAYVGAGVWALVAQNLTHTISLVFLFPFFSKWFPTKGFSRYSFLQLWKYGSRLLASGVLSAFVRNFANIIIGRKYDTEQVGYYSRAYTSAELPSKMLLDVLYNVSFPVFCEVQGEEDRMNSIFRRVLISAVLLVFPFIILLSLVAKPLVIILLTDKWLASVPYLQILLLARMFMPVSAIHEGIIGAKGHSDILLRLSIISSVLTIFSIIVAIPLGVKAMAYATLLAAVISYIITSLVSKRFTSYSLGGQLKDMWKIGICLIVMGSSTLIVLSLFENPWLQLICGFFVGLISYCVSCIAFKAIDKELLSKALNMIMSKFLRTNKY